MPSERILKRILGQLECKTKSQIWWITEFGNSYEFHFFPSSFTHDQVRDELTKIGLETFKYHVGGK